MIVLRKLPLWSASGSPTCCVCDSKGTVRLTTLNEVSGQSVSLVFCDVHEAMLANKLDRRRQAAALKRLGINSKPWKPRQ